MKKIIFSVKSLLMFLIFIVAFFSIINHKPVSASAIVGCTFSCGDNCCDGVVVCGTLGSEIGCNYNNECGCYSIPDDTPIPTAPPEPTVPPTYPTWNITVVPVCPSGKVQTQPLRMFRIIWPQMNQGPNNFDCVNDNSSISKHSETITPKNIINNMQGIYVGLENPIRDGKNANCSEGVSIEPSSITPVVTVIRQGNNPPTGDFVNFAQYMNPYNWMVRWDWNRLIGGNYTINFNLPVSMCGALTTTPIPPTCEIRPACLDVFPHPCLPPEPKGGWCPIKPTITPVPGCTKKPQGDANCDGKINGADYSFWLNRRCTSGCAITNLVADFNGDNKVDDNDYTIWFNNRQ